MVPYEEVIRWAEKRSGYVIGDFGCGKAKLAAALGNRHTVHSFDYVAANGAVIACDMAHVPMEDETLDVAVFSLSLMGANFTDYMREARRPIHAGEGVHRIAHKARTWKSWHFQEPSSTYRPASRISSPLRS